MNKKILIVSEYFYPEEFKINELALKWQSDGYQVDILTQIPTYPQGKVLEGFTNSWYSTGTYHNMKIYRVNAITGYRESLLKKLLKYFVFMFNASIVAIFIGRKYDYVFGYDVGPLTAMLPAVLIKKIYKKPLTIWVQDVWPDSVYAYGFKKRWLLSKILDTYVRFVYKNCRAIAISSPGFFEKIRPYVNEKKIIKYLPNWADDISSNSDRFQFSKDEKTHFTFAGNIGKVQNLKNIIDAFSTLDHELIEKAQLNIIGDGSYLEFLKNYVIQKRSKNIVFWGRKPRNEIAIYLNGSDFLIVSLIDKPIFSLTVPAKVQTYIAAKKPILGAINGDAAKIINENCLGICTDPSDIQAIAQGFDYLIKTSKEEREIFAQQCEALTQGVFNKNKIIDEMGALTIHG